MNKLAGKDVFRYPFYKKEEESSNNMKISLSQNYNMVYLLFSFYSITLLIILSELIFKF